MIGSYKLQEERKGYNPDCCSEYALQAQADATQLCDSPLSMQVSLALVASKAVRLEKQQQQKIIATRWLWVSRKLLEHASVKALRFARARAERDLLRLKFAVQQQQHNHSDR